MSLTRRSFIKRSTAIGAALGAGLGTTARVLGANNDIRVAVVGFRGKGRQHIQVTCGIKGVRVVALCDADRSILAREKKALDKKRIKVAAYTDVRKVLDSKDVDAIITATPNHWHSLLTVWACQAGKDVYVEKPVSHEVWEGRKAVEATRKYKRIVQAGTQNRSDVGLRSAFRYIHGGRLGKVQAVIGLCHKRRGGIGKTSGPQPVPESVDYDLWCGPSPKGPLRRKKLHYDWHWFWDTGNGDIGNQGIHEMDLCRWAIQADGLPSSVFSIGGRMVWNDDGQTANTQLAVLDYPQAPVIFSVRNLPRETNSKSSDHYRSTRVGVVVQCENGYFAGGRGGGWVYDNKGKKVKQFKGDGGRGHNANFFKAVRSRKVSDLAAEVLEGHHSSAMCHVANISHRLGAKTAAGQIREKIKSNKLASEWFEQVAEHLKRNGATIDTPTLSLGEFLEIDPKAERFTNSEQANRMLRREYRKPFVLSENV